MGIFDQFENLSKDQAKGIIREFNLKAGTTYSPDDSALEDLFYGTIQAMEMHYIHHDLLAPLWEIGDILEGMGVPNNLFGSFLKCLAEDGLGMEKLWAGISDPEKGIYILIPSPISAYGEYFVFSNPRENKIKMTWTKKYKTFKIPVAPFPGK